ncbi:hypothetical protein [Tenacibaculum singaporense]|uniref:Uncharacterized protein n=1 Tax=Tenacibaculum singaporense TaxID=2358479 RepID=A0A3S8R642_9FLAO|nr:hypothetical protein [Tenacibaculum singaporense]AZJ35260.1 hypothetical protein D6T69_06900 [Tenacibaculum singaporense]
MKSYLERLSNSEVLSLSKFVVEENFNHHLGNIEKKKLEKDILSVYQEEIKYIGNSKIFVCKDDYKGITGAIRVLKWNYIDKLPIESIFGIDPLMVVEDRDLHEIWHIGRFAIKKGVNDPNLFKKLMVCAISPICKHKGNIAFAECDSKLLRILMLLGIKPNIVGESINYLGSETIPISLPYEGLIEFYERNKDLILNNKLL